MGKLAPIFPYKKYREFHIFVGLSGLRLPYMKHENFHMTYMKFCAQFSYKEVLNIMYITYEKLGASFPTCNLEFCII